MHIHNHLITYTRMLAVLALVQKFSFTYLAEIRLIYIIDLLNGFLMSREKFMSFEILKCGLNEYFHEFFELKNTLVQLIIFVFSYFMSKIRRHSVKYFVLIIFILKKTLA